MRIAFLHIPKTAGQSIHHSLVDLFPQDKICPARTNEALYKLSVNDLSRYDLFSGHLDWSLVKLTGSFDFVFTVLRDPLDRILSFYFYLRKEALRLSQEGVALGRGLQAAIELSPEDYFTGASPEIRLFLDNHHNNFYSYYFASGTYNGCSLLSAKFPVGSDQLLASALSGISSLDKVYTLSSLSLLENDLKTLTGDTVKPIVAINVNKSVVPAYREEALTDLSRGWDWRGALANLTTTDYELYEKLSAIS